MSLVKQVERVIEEDGLRSNSRIQSLLFKRMILYKILRDAGVTTLHIGEMFNKNHATVINGTNKYSVYSKFLDFKDMEEDILKRIKLIPEEVINKAKKAIESNKLEILDIERRTEDLKKFVLINEKLIKREVYDESITKKVLLCNDYWQMKQLQEELKKDLH